MFKNICYFIDLFVLMSTAPACVVSYQGWAAEINPGFTLQTFKIILNNIFVAFLLWGAAFVWRYLAENLSTPHIRIMLGAYVIYVFYFMKEAYRVYYLVHDFSQAFGLSRFAIFSTLVLPHGALEFLAFILIAVFACLWLDGRIIFKPVYTWTPFLILVVAGLLETTLSDYLFKLYLMNMV